MKKMIIASLITLNAYAADINVASNNYSDDQCAYYSTTTGQFKITYKENLPWGSKVELVYGFNNTYGKVEWDRSGEEQMEAVAPYTWQTMFQEKTSSRGHYYADRLNFVFRITLPDGTFYYDNGGQSPMGHYSADMPRMTCKPETLEILNIVAI